MSFRHRITLAATVAVALAVVTASALTYVLVSGQLHRQIDSSLRDTARGLQHGVAVLHQPGHTVTLAVPPDVPPGNLQRILALGRIPLARGSRGRPLGREPGGRPLGRERGGRPLGRLLLRTPRSALGQDRGVFQLLGSGGKVLVTPGGGSAALPVDARARRLLASGRGSYFSQTRIGPDDLRVLTVALPPGTPARAAQIARSLNEVDHTLSNLRLILLAVVVGGIAVAALLGQLVSRAAMAPVRRLGAATEHVARTRDLARRIPVRGGDELSRLAGSFNAMLDALEGSVQALDTSVKAQRQLVADASHELRTPVTSLRANIEVLQQSRQMPDLERERLLCDVVDQIESLTALVNDVIELARGEAASTACEDVRLDELVAECAEYTLRHAPGALVECDLEPTLVVGDSARLGRAIRNLLENALKFAPRQTPVEVTLRGGQLTVRDHGPGIPPDEAGHVFDRFYRGRSARALPGSGLGLAIVRQVAESHGGSVAAESAPGGGTLMRLRLPTAGFSSGSLGAEALTAP